MKRREFIEKLRSELSRLPQEEIEAAVEYYEEYFHPFEGFNEEERKEIFRKVSKKTGSVLLATGAKDLLVDQNRCLILENGVPELSGITGTGCMVGALSAAFLAQRDPFVAALLGTSVMGIAGEIAAKRSTGPGSFQMELLDAVAGLTQEELEARIRIREIGI